MLPHEAAGSGGNGKGKGWVHRTAMGPALVSTKSPARIFRASGFSSWVWIARLSGRAPYTGSKPTLPTSTERCAPLCPIRSPGHCHRSSSVARAACPWPRASRCRVHGLAVPGNILRHANFYW